MNRSLFAFLIVPLFCLYATDLPKPYASVKLLPEYPFGYYTNESQIHDLFRKNNIQVVIEVGSWIGGGSTRHMGKLLNECGGTLYAVDTWLGSSTQQPGEIHYQPILPQVYEQFLSNMIHWDLTHTVIPLRMKSTEAAKTFEIRPDLVYIDAEHTTEAVYEDLTTWYPFVKSHGILCGDDWMWPSVRVAVERFAAENDLIIETSQNFWRFHEKVPSVEYTTSSMNAERPTTQ